MIDPVFIAEWLVTAALASRDSPLHPWRDAITRACLDRDPDARGHESCLRREAVCAVEHQFRTTFDRQPRYPY